MYELNLTSDERKAIDFVGNRYGVGHDLYKLLCASGVVWEPNDQDWDSTSNIIFRLPERVAWSINEILIAEDFGAALFADEFRAKLMRFSEEIV